MGNIDSFPALSQLKSAAEAIGGDMSAAAETQAHFFFNNTFPVISQLVSAGYALFGQTREAMELQIQFGMSLLAMLNVLPIVGHVKGIIQYSLGDNRGGNYAIIMASRSLGILTGSAIGRLCNCALLSILTGLLAAFLCDWIIAINLVLAEATNGTDIGYTSIILGDPITIGQGFDMFVQLFIDGFIALVGGGICLCMYTMICCKSLSCIQSCCCCGHHGASAGSGVYRGFRTIAELNNRANQLNPNNWRYGSSRGYTRVP